MNLSSAGWGEKGGSGRNWTVLLPRGFDLSGSDGRWMVQIYLLLLCHRYSFTALPEVTNSTVDPRAALELAVGGGGGTGGS